jgi:NhaA family Na+:H+ antiporter
MLVPALLFLALSPAPELRAGWGMSTATDIAFAVGVLALLGRRVPPALRVLLLALAIIDDIGAILVIALFYSSGVAWSGLGIAAAGVAGVLAFQSIGIRRALFYLVPGSVVWLGMLRAGVHPTIAGVVLGMLTPVRAWFGPGGFAAVTSEALEELRAHDDAGAPRGHELLPALGRVGEAHREAVAPVVRVQAELHPWVAYAIMPLFALANAGVRLDGGDAHAGSRSVLLGVLVGLLAGKPLGIVATSFVTVRLGLCALPRGVGWRGILVVGAVAGIGFTMAIFIAALAFTDPALLAAAKLGVLGASAASATLGLVLGVLLLPARLEAGAAQTEAQAEAATDA